MTPLPRSFFARSPLDVAPDLVGCVLVHETAAGRLAGRIVETEAYTDDDPAMHGWKAVFGADGCVLPQGRAADLFGPPGTAYVYRVYVTHWLLNVVCAPEGVAGAVLVRAAEPLDGLGVLREQRPGARRERDLTNGPAKLTEAFGLAAPPGEARNRFHGTDLTVPPLFFAARPAGRAPRIEATSRIGLSRGIDRPYRFLDADSAYVSPGVPSDERVRRRTGDGRTRG